MKQIPLQPMRRARGFTLVEILVVIAIIGILSAIAVPAITNAISTAKTTKMRLEVGSLETAINRYEEKYGDYPPDFVDWTVIERHYRKIFPRIATGELDRLRMLLDDDATNDTATTVPSPFPAHNGANMDRGEVLAWVLGGYSSNPTLPFTGAGGPLELVSSTATAVTYQINADRDNQLYPFDAARMDYTSINAAAAVSTTNRRLSSDGDLFAQYEAHSDGAPFVYFDSRTYAFFGPTIGDFNGYGSTAHGFVRPFYSNLPVTSTSTSDYGSLSAALGAWQFLNADTFQIVAPGVDGHFGTVGSFEFDSSSTGTEPVYFQYPTGNAIAPSGNTGVNTPDELVISGARKFQQAAKFGGSEEFMLDNLTNFSKAKLVDDVISE